jgi:23S rRNA (cytidine1920-2'-O)/16S rRNA (cytidine1409-2'-O)-methyltransferase
MAASKQAKLRLDQLLVSRGWADNRKQAAAILLSGAVSVKGQIVNKAGMLVDSNAEILLKSRYPKYVSRGGEKLAAALDHFKLNPAGLTCLDLGASTGGFTHCLLSRGAARIYAFDVGKGQLDWSLRQDERVIVREGFNVRNLRRTDLPEEIQLIVADLSFISLTRIFPSLADFHNAQIVALIKPQFEARPEEVEPGGVIRDESKRLEIIDRTTDFAQKEGFRIVDQIDSSVHGPKGNVEHFVLMKRADSENLKPEKPNVSR